MKYLTNIDLAKNQIIAAAIDNQATAPSSPVEGQIYFNTTSKRLFTWNGTAWVGTDAADAVIADGAVTNAKLADMAQSTIKGRATAAGTGDPTDLSAAQVKALLAITPGDIGAEPVISSKGTAFNKNYGATATDVKMNGTQGVGSVDAIARIDHVHPVDTSRAPATHVGLGGAEHPSATPSVAGFLSAVDKTILDGIVSGGISALKVGVAATNDDLNDCTATGIYKFTGTTANTPPVNGTSAKICVTVNDGGAVPSSGVTTVQTAFNTGRLRDVFTRKRIFGGSWTSWEVQSRPTDLNVGDMVGNATALSSFGDGFLFNNYIPITEQVNYLAGGDDPAYSGPVVRKISWEAIKTALKTYFDTLYNNYVHPTAAGSKHVPTGGAAGQFLKYGGSSGTASWAAHGLTKSDVGLGNVTNDAQVKKAASSTEGSIPKWSGANGDALVDGYTVEATLTGGSSALPRADAVKAYVDGLLSASDAMVFKGTLGTGGTITALPTTYSAGWTYRVITAATYAGHVCEVGDLIIAVIDREGTGNLNADRTVVQTNVDGVVSSVASAVTAGNLPAWNDTTGKILKNGYGVQTTLSSNASTIPRSDAVFNAIAAVSTPKRWNQLNLTTAVQVINHNLGTRELSVTVREENAPYAQVFPDVEFTTINAITLTFAVAPSATTYRITIIG